MSALGSFGPADFATLQDATAGLQFGGYDQLSAALKARIDEHNNRATKVKAQLTSSMDGFEQAIAKITEGVDPASFGELFTSVETAKIDRTTLLTELVNLWNNRVKLVDDSIADLQKQVAPAKEAYEKIVAEVKGDLIKIGSGPEAQENYAKSPQMAAEKFDRMARQRNIRSLGAWAKVFQLQCNIEAAQEAHRQSREGQASALKYIRTTARRLLAA